MSDTATEAPAEAPATEAEATQPEGQAPAPHQETLIPKHEAIAQIVKAKDRYDEAKQTVKNVEERIQDELDEMEAYKEFKAAEATLAQKKENLRIACLSNGELNNLKEQLAEEKAERKSRFQHLKSILWKYATDYSVRSVQLDPALDDENREIKLEGKLGRKLKEQGELPLR